MKNILILLFICSATLNAQKLKEYTASNGITYKKGGFVEMAQGSLADGNYQYMWITSILNKGGKISSRAYNGIKLKIKKIKRFKDDNNEKVLFLVKGNLGNYSLDIENAVKSCEVKDCNKEASQNTSKESKYDKLKKLKELLDSGVLTKEEFEIEKKKILEGN
jgi:hypothetical protein